jgi:ketosteroid isomerase-like protein
MRNIVLLALLALASPRYAPAQDSGDAAAKSNILALEHAWDQALGNSDVKALSAIFGNSLIYVDFDGKLMTKPEYLARVRSNAIHLEQVVADVVNVQILGSTAIVVGTYRVKGEANGKQYIKRGRFIDTWVLTGGQWSCIAASATPILER